MQVTEVIIVKFVPIVDMYFCTSVAVINKYYLAFVKKFWIIIIFCFQNQEETVRRDDGQ